jgi:hypothetical protein
MDDRRCWKENWKEAMMDSLMSDAGTKVRRFYPFLDDARDLNLAISVLKDVPDVAAESLL